MTQLLGCIEAGGTKFLCAVATGPEDILAETRIATTTPAETLQQTIDFFKQQQSIHGPLASVGIASFGPVDLNTESPQYGYITSTPKPGWAQTDLLGAIKTALKVPVAFDTDVNGAALAEYKWGSAAGLQTFVYFTIGTGIGGGGMVGGQLMHGLLHPEMGHMLIPQDKRQDPYEGHCPYHGNCLEGLASGAAIEDRWQTKTENLDDDHPAWDLESTYLAYLCVNITTILSPQRIILGGGVMTSRPMLFEQIRAKTRQQLNGYIQTAEIMSQIDDYIIPPALGAKTGLLGALALAQTQV